MLISGSIFAANLLNLQEEVNAVKSKVSRWHFDVMDGHLVPNFALSPNLFTDLKKITNLPIDVHLMTHNSVKHLSMFTGADSVAIHVESNDCEQALILAKKLYPLVGIAINPDTALDALNSIEKYADIILIMSVNPGFSGQKFIESSIDKIVAAKERFPQKKIIIDGGITYDIMNSLPCDICVMGSSLFKKG